MASGVNRSSVMGLQAELHAARQRAQRGKSEERPRKALRWTAPSTAPAPANAADADDSLAASRRGLAQKTQAYTDRAHGAHRDADEDGLVDWDNKDIDEDVGEEHAAHAAEVPAADTVEIVDEFGRTRTVPRSEVPEEDTAIYGPATSFPVYQHAPRSFDRPARPPSAEPDHFDPTFDRRGRGAAYYQFAGTEAERLAQQAALHALHTETERHRAHLEPAPVRRTTLGAARRAARQRAVDAHRTPP